MDIHRTRTEKNVLTAFAGESQARNRYTYFAEKAAEDSYHQIAAIFEETAAQEKEHARRLFGLLEGGEVEIQASFPAGVVGSTADNLQAAADGENYEHTQMYPEFAEVAREEGIRSAATIMDSIAVAEQWHEKRYLALLENLENGTAFARSEQVTWRCRNCGYVHTATDAPKVCPACAKQQGYFELLVQNW